MTSEQYTFGIKQYAQGKIYFFVKGASRYEKKVKAALFSPGVCDVQPIVWEDRFAAAMKDKGIPQDYIADYLENIRMDNDAYVKRDSGW